MSAEKCTLIADLLDLPDKVYKGHFVVDLTKGIIVPEKTTREYVVTPQLAASFGDALGFIYALESRRSKAAYSSRTS